MKRQLKVVENTMANKHNSGRWGGGEVKQEDVCADLHHLLYSLLEISLKIWKWINEIWNYSNETEWDWLGETMKFLYFLIY